MNIDKTNPVVSATFFRNNGNYLGKWLLLAVLIGFAGGLTGAAFSKIIVFASGLYRSTPYMKLVLPVSGVVSVALYKACKEDVNKGTNMVISAIHSDKAIPKKQGILIFISTILSHFGGASVGKEGAALQIGGSLGTFFADIFKLDDYDKNVMIMTGMSALFGSVFGTPVGAAIFPIEVISVGVMYYTALFPCMIASFFGAYSAKLLHAPVSTFMIKGQTGALEPKYVFWACVLGIFCAVLSVIFTYCLRETGDLYIKIIPNPYVRILSGAAVFTILILVFSDDYAGTGANLIVDALYNKVDPWAFVIKMLMTAIVIGAGYKGGEIVPTFTVGACFGATFGMIFHLDTHFTASLAMMGLFAGMTNCPISSAFMAIEMFGATGAPYYLIVISLSYALSGYKGLYKAQKIMYGKSKAKFINKG